jgi:Tfp pilus assembly protein PilV
MISIRPNPRGFTLVETIFSTLFISLTVLAIINLFPGAYLSVKKSEAQLQSDLIANSILEELRSTGNFDNLPAGPYLESEEPFVTKKVDGITYSPKVSIYDVTDTDPLLVRGVIVEVTYRVRTIEKTVVYETYLHSLI